MELNWTNFRKNDSDFRLISGYLDTVGTAVLSRTRPLSRSQLFPGRLALNKENWTFPGAPASFSEIVYVTAPVWVREHYGGVKWLTLRRLRIKLLVLKKQLSCLAMEIILAKEPGLKLNSGCCWNSIHFQSIEWHFPFQLDGNLNGQIDTLELVETHAKPVEKPKDKEIPYRTLVLHRCLVLLVMVLILAVGIIVNQILRTLVTWKNVKSQSSLNWSLSQQRAAHCRCLLWLMSEEHMTRGNVLQFRKIDTI